MDILQMCEDAIKAGAIGVTFGRNIFQHNNPNEIIKALHAIIMENKHYGRIKSKKSGRK
jgi:fructose-bisphosphate aldolase/2-amino-3,7-dideoxy-D-threo-hept-6-ulosonate synthase